MHLHVWIAYWFIIISKTCLDRKSACFEEYLLGAVAFVFLWELIPNNSRNNWTQVDFTYFSTLQRNYDHWNGEGKGPNE